MKAKIHSFAACPPLMGRLAPVFVFLFLVLAAQACASDRWATLEAIHQLENPRNSEAPGALGELGPYQFREATWKAHTCAPFSRALDRRVSDAVAVKHYDWLKSELERHGLEATPYRIALAWNGGMRAVLSGKPPAAAAEYAARAANLAAEFGKNKLADAR
ncbi:MAG TPA: hypothetical protein VII43_09540 [Opitutaceae bacterium]